MSTRQTPASRLAQDGPSTESVLAMLRTPWSDVYGISLDRATYIRPQCLRDTPVAKLTESSDYWRDPWDSMDAYMAQEQEEERLKKETGEALKLDPGNKKHARDHKLHMDNVSKHRRIRDIFGSKTTYHPNQLAAWHHLPRHGLCRKDIMYRLACKVSDLRVLKEKGEMAMDPWDFLRWRIAKKIESFVIIPGHSVQENIQSIMKVCEEPGKNPAMRQYDDPLLRAAILRSARYQGRIGSFRAKDKINQAKLNGFWDAQPRPRAALAHRPRAGGLSRLPLRPLPPVRVEKRPQTGGYQGVNAYRAQKKLRDAEKNKKSDK